MILLSLLLAVSASAQEPKASSLITVPIAFVEALAPRDTTSSVRYQQSYEGTIAVATELLEKKLNRCGYRFETKTAFYDASDALKAKEFGAKAASEGSWLIVSPRRSNHYLLLVQGAEEVPTASLMASSDKVGELGPRHRSLSPINSKMAAIAVQETKLRTKKGARYVSVISSDCANCVDFAKAFETSAATAGLKKVSEILLTGEAVAAGDLREKVKSARPDFVLLPNYSKVSSAVMAAFNDEKSPPLFVGGDGWGDAQYGFVQNGLDVQNVKGITVRGFPPIHAGLAEFPLGKKILNGKLKGLTFTPDLSILRILDETAKTLCFARPKTREAFRIAFEGKQGNGLNAPWGVSIFELKRGEIHFAKTLGISR
jgi:ABC-type branched-subunit amino acid transport system substrate-binding protein